MNNTKGVFALSLVPFVLAGCLTANPPKPDEIRAANYGTKPSTTEMVSAVKNHMSKQLIDPYSAVYACSNPTKAWVTGGSGSEGNVQFNKTYYGYLSTCTINAKNKLGGYTGSKEYDFMIYVQNGERYLAHFDGYGAAGQVP